MNIDREIASILAEEQRDKRSAARGAYHRVTHAKSVKLPCPTEREVTAKSGECIRIFLNAPMSWCEFTKIPSADIQAEYLVRLAERFGVGEDALPALFHARPEAIARYLTDRGIAGIMQAAIQQRQEVFDPLEDRRAWLAFLSSKWAQKKDISTEPAVSTVNPRTHCAQMLKGYRSSKGLSQKELADMLGISQPYLSMVESEKASTNVTARIMAEFTIKIEGAPTEEQDSKPAPQELELTGSVQDVLRAIKKTYGKDAKISVHVTMK